MKYAIYTLGCKVNQYESEAIAKQLKDRGDSVSFGLVPADVYILNTCAVTNEAEHKSREVIAKMVKLNKDARIYVCGCSSELHPKKFLDRPNIVAVIGTENKNKLLEIIDSGALGDRCFNINNFNYNDNYSIDGERIRSFIKIQDGCNNFCSYCIIPYTRGRERSRTIESTINEYERVAKSSKEIVLVGINMAGYGKDLEGKPTLTDLVNKLAKFSKTRLRFSSFEMGTISVELLEALKSHPNFCPFFHLSLQSGADNVLRKMNRHYTFDEYLSCVELIRKYFPNAGISTDIIVGFPTETDEDFNECLENVKRAKFTDSHIFPFSKREGTVAGSMPIINGEIIKTRVKRLEEVTNASKSEFLEFMKGKTEEVLIEEEKDGYLVGFTKNYIKCYIDTKTYKNPQEITNKYLNSVAQVKLTEIYKLGMKGELI